MFKNSLGKPTRRNPSITQSKNIGMISTSNSQILKLRTHNNLIYLRNEKINKERETEFSWFCTHA